MQPRTTAPASTGAKVRERSLPVISQRLSNHISALRTLHGRLLMIRENLQGQNPIEEATNEAPLPSGDLPALMVMTEEIERLTRGLFELAEMLETV